jgi:hypothetical protein
MPQTDLAKLTFQLASRFRFPSGSLPIEEEGIDCRIVRTATPPTNSTTRLLGRIEPQTNATPDATSHDPQTINARIEARRTSLIRSQRRFGLTCSPNSVRGLYLKTETWVANRRFQGTMQ